MICAADPLAELTSQAQEYLEAVCRIADRGDAVTLKALSHELHVAPPSVIGMLKRQEEQGLLRYSRQTGVQLTAHGQHCASTLRRRHRLAECLLTDLLAIPWERAHEIACRFEHVIDDEVEGYLATALDHPDTCPHGNPITEAAAPPLAPLTTLDPGSAGCLRRIVDETAPFLSYLHDLRLQPGVRVTVCERAPFDGPLTVEINGERHALSRETADRLLVEKEGLA
ncbi:MAG TPA: metal-dependent transcriptional regulator [Armatimonadota bacterium]